MYLTSLAPVVGTVPEPSTLAVAGSIGLVALGLGWRGAGLLAPPEWHAPLEEECLFSG